jgi:hypothetical protein
MALSVHQSLIKLKIGEESNKSDIIAIDHEEDKGEGGGGGVGSLERVYILRGPT